MGEGKAIREKLWDIQQKLRAAKEQHNDFGGYNYRSQEDILHAVKPFLSEHRCTLVTGDEMVCVGERNYVKATAVLCDIETGDTAETIAYAREPLVRKGMDESQITGATSSYARKCALNGLFAIDDAKDPDATNVGKDETEPKPIPHKPDEADMEDAKKQLDTAIDRPGPKISAAQVKLIKGVSKGNGWEDWGDSVCKEFGFNRQEDVTRDMLDVILEKLKIGPK